MARLKFSCGCPAVDINVDKNPTPKCPRCGDRRVVRNLDRTPPRFVGHGRGPLVQGAALEAIPVRLAPQGALRLKAPRKDED